MAKVSCSIAYTDQCLPDYFRGDARPWVAVPCTERGYTSRELRAAILYEFEHGAIGGHDPITADYIPDERARRAADAFYQRALPACLNREVKYRGKRAKDEYSDGDEYADSVYLYVVFNVAY